MRAERKTTRPKNGTIRITYGAYDLFGASLSCLAAIRSLTLCSRGQKPGIHGHESCVHCTTRVISRCIDVLRSRCSRCDGRGCFVLRGRMFDRMAGKTGKCRAEVLCAGPVSPARTLEADARYRLMVQAHEGRFTAQAASGIAIWRCPPTQHIPRVDSWNSGGSSRS